MIQRPLALSSTLVICALILSLTTTCGDGEETPGDTTLDASSGETLSEVTVPLDSASMDTLPEETISDDTIVETIPDMPLAELSSDSASPDSTPEVTEGLPTSLPFEFSRPEAGEPLTDEEVTSFTEKLTGLYVAIDYFDWVLWYSHGVDASTGMRDYKL
jgi:hypothetical protein